jgi:DNA-binding MarR family transcriptional regulator
MATQVVSPETCASLVIETVPRVNRCLRAEMRRQGASGLSLPQFRALGFLQREPGASLSAVAEHLGVSRSTASAIADRLVRAGLVDRAPDPAERRRVALTLTPAGADLLARARAATRTLVADRLARLSAAQLTAIAAGVAALGDAFRGVAAARPPEDASRADKEHAP